MFCAARTMLRTSGELVERDHRGRQVLRVGVDRVAEQHQLHDRHADQHREGQPVAPQLHELLAQHGGDALERQARTGGFSGPGRGIVRQVR